MRLNVRPELHLLAEAGTATCWRPAGVVGAFWRSCSQQSGGEMGWGVGVSISCVCPYLLPMSLPWKPSRLSLALLRSAPSSWDCARDVEVEHELLQMSPRSFQVPPTNSRFFQLTLCSVSLRGFRLSPGHLGLCPGGHCCSPQAVRGILPRSGFEFQSLF